MKKEKTNIGIVIIKLLIFASMIFCMVKSNDTHNVWLKGSASLCFVVVGFMNMFLAKEKNVKYAVSVFLALFFGFAGDVVIMLNFMIGALVFLLGHILYIIAYHFIVPVEKKEFVTFFIVWVIAEAILITLTMTHNKGTTMTIVAVIYATVISFMVGKSISNYIKKKNQATLIICIASIVFLISDIFVLITAFKIIPKQSVRLMGQCLYYPAQFTLAQSILRVKKESKNI